MSSKTPISILQELMVQRKERLPDYFIENCSDQPGSTFKCTVKAGSITAVGYAGTKKDAKQNSAKKALDILGGRYSPPKIDIVVNYSPKNFSHASINYVGKLNEIASQYGKPYPEYDESVITTGTFSTRCTFLEFVSEGYGPKKKDSKQDAAKHMLEILKNVDVRTVTLTMENLELSDNKKIDLLTKEVLTSYNKLTVTVNNLNPSTTKFLPIPDLKKTVYSMDDLRRELGKYGYKYSTEVLQRSPYIIMMKITGTNATIMGSGDNKELAFNDLFENAVLMFDHGFTLKTEL